MIRRPAAVATRSARAVRGLWPDRNPLRRTIDRIEAVVVGGLVVAFLAAAPLAAVAGGHAVYGNAARIAQAQQATWHQVSAVLLATAPAAQYRQNQVNAQARWTAPDGTRHSGTVLAPPGTTAGHVVMVWVDMAGRPTGDRPLQLSQVRNAAELAAVLAPLALGLILLGAGFSVHLMLGRRRLAAWDADWQVTEPHWTKRPLDVACSGSVTLDTRVPFGSARREPMLPAAHRGTSGRICPALTDGMMGL